MPRPHRLRIDQTESDPSKRRIIQDTLSDGRIPSFRRGIPLSTTQPRHRRTRIVAPDHIFHKQRRQRLRIQQRINPTQFRSIVRQSFRIDQTNHRGNDRTRGRRTRYRDQFPVQHNQIIVTNDGNIRIRTTRGIERRSTTSRGWGHSL